MKIFLAGFVHCARKERNALILGTRGEYENISCDMWGGTGLPEPFRRLKDENFWRGGKLGIGFKTSFRPLKKRG